MKTFIGTTGVIDSSGWGLGVVVKRVQSDVNDSAATDVGVVLSGVGTAVIYDFNAITPVEQDLIFPPDVNVNVATSGDIRNAIINYVHAGSVYGNKYRIAGEAQNSGVVANDFYVPGQTANNQKWAPVVQSGSMATGFGG